MTHLKATVWTVALGALLMGSAAQAGIFGPVPPGGSANGVGSMVKNNLYTFTDGNNPYGLKIHAGWCGIRIEGNTFTGATSFDIQDLNSSCCNTYINNTFNTASGPPGCIQ